MTRQSGIAKMTILYAPIAVEEAVGRRARPQSWASGRAVRVRGGGGVDEESCNAFAQVDR